MSSMSALIDFLVSLMRSDDAQTAFEQDPEGTLARNGLEGVTSQDVRDARLVMCDSGGARPQSTGTSAARHDDPVREIRHTTQNFEVDKNYNYDVDQTFNLINIDDRDTTIEDSFNSNDNNDIRTVAIQDNSRDTNIEIEDSFNDGPEVSGPTQLEEPAAEDPTVSIDPVEEAPGAEDPIEEPVAEDPIVSIDPVEDVPLAEPVEDEPELAHADAAII